MNARIPLMALALSAAACTTDVDDAVAIAPEPQDVNAKTQSVCMIGVRAAAAQLDGTALRLVVHPDGCGMDGELVFYLTPHDVTADLVELDGEVEHEGEVLHDAYGVWGQPDPQTELGFLHVMLADEGDVVAEMAGEAMFDAEGHPYRFDGELWVLR